MTENYKKDLLNYIINKVNISTETKMPVKYLNITTNLNTYLHTISEDFVALRVIDTINFDYSILYGYYTEDEVEYGAIVILDENYNPITHLTEYDSGTKLNVFVRLEFDENGYLYGIDETSNGLRFIMLNNPLYTTTEEYEVKIRYSIYLDTSVIGSAYSVEKVVGSPIYIFSGRLNANTVIATLKIEVGQPNEWNSYAYTEPIGIEQIFYTYENGEFSELGAFCWGGAGGQRGTLYKLIVSGSSLILDSSFTIPNGMSYMSVIKKNSNLLYVLYYNSDVYVLGYIDWANNRYIELKELPETYTFTELTNVNNLMFMTYCYEENNIKYTKLLFVDIDDNLYQFDFEVETSTRIRVKNIYNLYDVYVYSTESDEATIFQLIYNSNNYNGEYYSNYNSLKPKYGNIYDNSNEKRCLLSRNIYDKTVYNNTTVSTIEAPNTLLNNTTIKDKVLITETGMESNIDDSIINTNIYETLFINYINSIIASNENEEKIVLSNTSNYINSNINIGSEENIENSFIGKYRVNYADDTTSVGVLTINKLNDLNAQIKFSLEVTKEINNIEFISNDETTTYLTINPTLEIGNTYTIKQKVRTGNQVELEGLYYNNNEVQYSNESINAYKEVM